MRYTHLGSTSSIPRNTARKSFQTGIPRSNSPLQILSASSRRGSAQAWLGSATTCGPHTRPTWSHQTMCQPAWHATVPDNTLQIRRHVTTRRGRRTASMEIRLRHHRRGRRSTLMQSRLRDHRRGRRNTPMEMRSRQHRRRRRTGRATSSVALTPVVAAALAPTSRRTRLILASVTFTSVVAAALAPTSAAAPAPTRARVRAPTVAHGHVHVAAHRQVHVPPLSRAIPLITPDGVAARLDPAQPKTRRRNPPNNVVRATPPVRHRPSRRESAAVPARVLSQHHPEQLRTTRPTESSVRATPPLTNNKARHKRAMLRALGIATPRPWQRRATDRHPTIHPRQAHRRPRQPLGLAPCRRSTRKARPPQTTLRQASSSFPARLAPIRRLRAFRVPGCNAFIQRGRRECLTP